MCTNLFTDLMYSYPVRRSNMTCALKVDTSCAGWERTTIKILEKIKGVSYDLDARKGIIYITGKVEPRKILRKVATQKNNIRLMWIRTEDQLNSFNNNEMGYSMPMHPSAAYPYMEPPHHHTGFYPPPYPQIPDHHQYHSYEPYPPRIPYYY